jgi:mannose-6-phosphate isomerase-like protein (cupin superfamily)
MAGIDGVDHHVKQGDMMFFPARVFHSIKVLTERIKLLVIYSPPYGEDPEKLIRS